MLRKVLMADGDARLRRITRQIIAGLASGIYEASNGVEAIEGVRAERPEWVLLDLHLNPMDGLQALARIKELIPETRVILTSRDDDSGLRSKALRRGACGYLLKENLHALPAFLTELPDGLLGAEVGCLHPVKPPASQAIDRPNH